MKKTKKMALSGVFTAVCVVLLAIGTLIDTLDLTAAALASFVIIAALIEFGKGYALGIYAAASVLAVVLLPNKTAGAIFLCFTGFYPILKVYLNKIKPKVVSYIVRMAVFNVFLTVLILFSTKVLGITDEFLTFGYLIYLIANITFIVYDLVIEKLSIVYCVKIRKKLFGSRL